MVDSQLARTIQRKNCPFYGFHYFDGIMVDQKGNKCALLTDGYHPCQMETRSEVTDWNRCPINNAQTRSIISQLENNSIFPEEMGDKGISLREWMKYFISSAS